MSKRRLLPEAAYDFWAEDDRDGETTPKRDTLAEAKADQKAQRARFSSWSRGCIQLRWAVNERKVLRLLSTGAP